MKLQDIVKTLHQVSRLRMPEHQLAARILDVGIKDSIRIDFYRREHHREYDSANLWIKSHDKSHVFDFENICEYLSIPPDILRDLIKNDPDRFRDRVI